jgi:hypothetical protein
MLIFKQTNTSMSIDFEKDDEINLRNTSFYIFAFHSIFPSSTQYIHDSFSKFAITKIPFSMVKLPLQPHSYSIHLSKEGRNHVYMTHKFCLKYYSLSTYSFLSAFIFHLDDRQREMSENNSHFNTVWTKLLNAMEQMFQLQSLSPSAYMNLYQYVSIF